MESREVAGLNYPLHSNLSPYSSHYFAMENNIPSFQPHGFSNQNPHHPVLQDIGPQSYSCISINSTSYEADQQQQSLNIIINGRKQRRMISNRESARRSRMRKQKHLDELSSHVLWLRNENQRLIEKLNHVSESHDRVVQENSQLKEEASELRQMRSDMTIQCPCHSLGLY